MTKGRLIIILEREPSKSLTHNFHLLCRELDKTHTPTFALGLVADITLALTGQWGHLIYNAYEFLPITDAKSWQIIGDFESVYTVIGGKAWEHNTPIEANIMELSEIQLPETGHLPE